MFSTTTVDMSTSTPMASAMPPSVMMFTVWPVMASASTAPMSAIGILSTTIEALRQSRRNSRTMSPVSNAPRAPSVTRLVIALVTYPD